VQDGRVVRDLPLITPDGIARPENLVEVLSLFISYTEPALADWEHAVDEFRERLPELGRSVRDLIQRSRSGFAPNKKFVAAFDALHHSLPHRDQPDTLRRGRRGDAHPAPAHCAAFGTVFSNPEFTRRNVVAVEIEKVIDALASGHFDRADFLGKLDRFYLAIENAARTSTTSRRSRSS